MIYVIRSYEEILGIFEGPDHIILDKVRKDFNKMFEVQEIRYPEYSGPTVPYKIRFGGCVSGALFSNEGDPVPDETSQEYKQWVKATQQASKDYDKRYKERVKELKKMYPGKDEDEMLISYLKAEYGLREVSYSEF